MCKFIEVTITPEDISALGDVVLDAMDGETKPGAEVAYKWLTYARERLYQEWQKLDSGSQLKGAYLDEVWEWSDRDIINQG